MNLNPPVWMQSMIVVLPLIWIGWHSTQSQRIELRRHRSSIFLVAFVGHLALAMVLSFIIGVSLARLLSSDTFIFANDWTQLLGFAVQTVGFALSVHGRRNSFTTYFTNLIAIGWAWVIMSCVLS
jgi:hypothetical protein